VIPIAASADAARRATIGVPRAVWAITGAAWAVSLYAAASGGAAALHHHELIEGRQPLWLVLPVFLVAWLVMVAAMMLPSSIPALRALAARPSTFRQPAIGFGRFILAYALVWSAFGLVALLGDMVIHEASHALPWLEDTPWLIAGSLFAAAGVFELSPLKRGWLRLCREPDQHIQGNEMAGRIGLEHALACVGSSGALMLVMFGAGIANLLWMALLAVVMTYQALGRRGMEIVPLVGIALLALALLALLNPGLPAWLFL
jgi:predicted metal-binding membrane protein